MEILHRDDLPLGGFAGLKEHRLITDRRVFGASKSPGAWDGVGNFVYFADARFMPRGETGMHPHHEVDVISVMVEGRVSHGGSLESGAQLVAPDVQVQRAGGEGFEHNEVNPDTSENRMLQLWVLPEQPGEPAGYRVFHPERGKVTRVYGGESPGAETFASKTTIDIAVLEAGQEATFRGPLLAYLSRGRGRANGREVTDGDLVRSDELTFSAEEDVQLTVVSSAE